MSTPPSKFFNRYEFDEDVRDERDRLRAVNELLLAALELVNSYPNIRTTIGTDVHDRVRAAIAEAQKATGGQ